MQADLEALEEQRDAKFLACCKSGTEADWAEYERVATDLRAKLLARLDAYLAAGCYEHLADVLHNEEMARYDESELPVTIDREALEAWEDSQSDIPY